ncbi:transposase-like zinc-binding domain-containing protein [Microcystis sp. M59BS1]|uniref:transposase-like zinc-binding domain-containing protein n=1 Tax=Microcystis sp. M59BS1 TaxID=2771201 RepID=UPI003F9026D8
MKCPECQSDHINKNGHRGQKQNYIPELPPYIYTIIAENPYPSMDTPLNIS